MISSLNLEGEDDEEEHRNRISKLLKKYDTDIEDS